MSDVGKREIHKKISLELLWFQISVVNQSLVDTNLSSNANQPSSWSETLKKCDTNCKCLPSK